MRVAAIACWVLAAAVLTAWAVSGAHIVNQEKRLVTTVVVDDFGDEETQEEWVEDFRLGLVDGAGPPAGFFALLGAGLFFVDLRRRRRA